MEVRFGAFVFDGDRRQLLRDGVEVHVTRKAFDLLALLIQRTPAVVSKQDIHSELWPDAFVSDAALAGLIKELRRAVRDSRTGRIIRTAHGVGFAFAAPVEAGAPGVSLSATHWIVAGARTFPLRDGSNVIGRDPEATVPVDAPGVSRRHARITVADGAATLEDLGSKNGTLVCDRPVNQSVRLRNGDRIQVASEVLTFRASASGISTATQPTRSRPA
jgi:DNA-binding winged helix-turn-helix (wHTH) protein